ncbi:MAG: hypothetical protein H0U32_10330 [Thermoleophilaceae bacterium]|nr:hypothetical protein [Thermoleophilaceae bacterium]
MPRAKRRRVGPQFGAAVFGGGCGGCRDGAFEAGATVALRAAVAGVVEDVDLGRLAVVDQLDAGAHPGDLAVDSSS